MRNILFIGCLILCNALSSQTDSNSSVGISFDTTWNHSILEADLVLYAEITKRLYVTQAAYFYCDILKVVKGKFSKKKLNWYMELIEYSRERSDQRFAAINRPFNIKGDPFKVYIGFYATNFETSDIQDTITGKRYNFFMSSEELR